MSKGTARLIYIIGILLIIIACFGFDGGDAAATIGMIGAIMFIVGVIVALVRGGEENLKEQAKEQADMIIRSVQMGVPVSDEILDPTKKQREQKKETATIVKNAAVGGIIAGPAGAAVGAVVGKNKVDSQKNNPGT